MLPLQQLPLHRKPAPLRHSRSSHRFQHRTQITVRNYPYSITESATRTHMPQKATLVLECVGILGLGGSPISAELDDVPIFLAWDRPQVFDVEPGRHGLRISYEPIRWPFGANKLARAIDLNGGFRTTLRYIPRIAPMLPPKLIITVDRN
jgi:hypothetical protein